MIVEKWGVKDHCVDCGLPCARTICPYYSAGATVECDKCGYEWDVPLDSPEMGEDCGDYHLCKVCREIGELDKVTHRVQKIKPMKTHTTTDQDSVESTDLFDLGSVRMDSPRLKEIKEHDIQTHHAPHMEEAPWLAIPMKEARELLAGYDLTEDEKNNLPAMMAGYCLLLDESGMIFEGDSEREVQDAALDFCRSNNGDCHLCKVCREIGELDKARAKA